MNQSTPITLAHREHIIRRVSAARVLFVISTGRAGTQSLARLLDSSPKVLAVHERSPRFLAQTQKAFACNTAEAAEIAAEFAATRFERIEQAGMARIYAETSHRIGYLARALAKIFPSAQFVHLHRHPGEFIRSAMRRRWYDTNSIDRWRIQPDPSDPVATRWPEMAPFEKLCWYWGAVNAFAREFTREAGERSLTLGFDEIYCGARGAERLFHFLDVPRPPPATLEKTLAKRFNAQRTGAFPLYEEWSDQLRQTLWDISGDVAEELGYEI